VNLIEYIAKFKILKQYGFDRVDQDHRGY